MAGKNQMPDPNPPEEMIGYRDPVKLFDDYYFIGNRLIGFHVLKTSEGLVIFDAMDTVDADEKFLFPGLKALGLENEKIRILFLTHGHFDHYMAADHLWRKTGCDVALSKEDSAYMVTCDENRDKDPSIPRITRVVKDGDVLTFGDHQVYVMGAEGHTPGCLNYSFDVHEGSETHRVLMMGGYGVFGPGSYPGGEYPYGRLYAIDQALKFSYTCVKSWEYCKEHQVDVYLNPHPHLCKLWEHAEENKKRKPGEPNAHVIGLEGVRRWIVERYEVCLESAQKFTDIREEL